MTYRVVLPQQIIDAIETQIDYLVAQGAPDDRVQTWIDGLFDLASSLADWPRRFPVAESLSAAAGFEVRRANYGDHALFFRVSDDPALVEILAFRHAGRRPWSADDPEAAR